MKRRRFIVVLGGAAVCPLAGYAQQPEGVRRVGVLMSPPESSPVTRASVTAFVQALKGFGWVEGENIRIDYRFAAGDPTLLKTYAADLVGMSPDAILTGSSAAVVALRQQTRTIPIVFTGVGDPVGQGFVQSLARPGGNITGFGANDPNVNGKIAAIAPRGRASCHARRRHLQPRHCALRPLVQPRDRGRCPIDRDHGDACPGAR